MQLAAYSELAKCLNAFDLIVSIDETSINSSIHGAYGWDQKEERER